MLTSPSLAALTALALLAIGAGERTAHAHGLDAGHLTLELDDTVVRLVATPPVGAFPWADDDGDGRFDRGEVAVHRAALREAFDRALVLHDDQQNPPRCSPTDVSTPGSGAPPGTPPPPVDHVRITRLCRFAAPPRALTVGTTTASAGPVTVEAIRMVRGPDGSTRAAGPAERATLPDASATATVLSLPATAPPWPSSPATTAPWRLALLALAATWFARRRARTSSPLLSSRSHHA